MADHAAMEQLVALCKRRGFVFPASEIYGGINGFWDYGPLGTQLKNNIRDHWWRHMVECPPIGPDGAPLQIVGLDSSIIQNPKTWVASGHVGGFNDPMQTCRQCKKLFRSDHVQDMLSDSPWYQSLTEVFLQESQGEQAASHESVEFDAEQLRRWARDRKRGKKLAPGLAMVRDTDATLTWIAEEVEKTPQRQYGVAEAIKYLATERLEDTGPVTPCPNCGGDLTEPRLFNLMFESYAGAVQDESSKVYLRPETAQGIFLNYKNILDTMRVKLPFGIAQIGKAFRNEVTPRNFIFRSREFEQMEMEWFCPPDDARQWYEFWKAQRMDWWLSMGVSKENLIFRDHDADELAHYSQACVDVEYKYPFTTPNFGELEGIAHRGCFDLTQHQEHAKCKLEYFDQERNERYLPHVIEPASGLTRGVLVLLCEAYTPDETRPSKVFMKFHPRLAPIKAGIFPLVNKEGMPEVAQKLYLELRPHYTCQFDVKQSIGKRYARMDEAGTPYCFTVDGQTLEDDTVTVRHRDTQAQERINITQVRKFLAEKIDQAE